MRNAIPYLAQTFGSDLKYVLKVYPPIAPSGLVVTEFDILSIGEFSSQARVDGSSTYSSVSVTLADSSGWLLAAIQDSELEGIKCDIFVITDDAGTQRLWLKGRTTGAPAFSEENNSLSFSVEAFYVAKPVDTSLDEALPGILTSAINKQIPIVQGWGYRVPALKVKGSITFKATVTAQFNDATILIPGGSAFPQGTPILVYVGPYAIYGSFAGDVFTPDYNWNGIVATLSATGSAGSQNIIVPATTPIPTNFVYIGFYRGDGLYVTYVAQVNFLNNAYCLTLPVQLATNVATVQILGYLPQQYSANYGFAFDGEYTVTYVDPQSPGVAEFLIFGDGATDHTIKKIEAKFEGSTSLCAIPPQALSLDYLTVTTLDGRTVTARRIRINEFAYGTHGMDFSEIYVTSCNRWYGYLINDELAPGIKPADLLTGLVTKWMPGFTTEFPLSFMTKGMYLNFEWSQTIDPYDLISQVARECLLSTTIDGTVIRFRSLLSSTSVFNFTDDNTLFKSITLTNTPENDIQNEITTTIKLYTSQPTYVYKRNQAEYGKHAGTNQMQFWREMSPAYTIADWYNERKTKSYKIVSFQATVDALILEPFDVVYIETSLITGKAIVRAVATDSNKMLCNVTVMLVEDEYFSIPSITTTPLRPEVSTIARPPLNQSQYEPPKNIYRVHMVDTANDIYTSSSPVCNPDNMNHFAPTMVPAFALSGLNYEAIITQYMLWWDIFGHWTAQHLRTVKCTHAKLSLPFMEKWGWTTEAQRSNGIQTLGGTDVPLAAGRSGPYYTLLYPGSVPFAPGSTGYAQGHINIAHAPNESDLGYPFPYQIGDGEKVQPSDYYFNIKQNIYLSAVVNTINGDSFDSTHPEKTKVYPFGAIKATFTLDNSFPGSSVTLYFKAMVATHSNDKWTMTEVEVPGISEETKHITLTPSSPTQVVTFNLLKLPPELKNLYIVAYENITTSVPTRSLVCAITKRMETDPSADCAVVKVGHCYMVNGYVAQGGNVFYCNVYANGIEKDATLRGDPYDSPTGDAYVAALTDVKASMEYVKTVFGGNNPSIAAVQAGQYEQFDTVCGQVHALVTDPFLLGVLEGYHAVYLVYKPKADAFLASTSMLCRILNYSPTDHEKLNAITSHAIPAVYGKYMIAKMGESSAWGDQAIYEGNLGGVIATDSYSDSSDSSDTSDGSGDTSDTSDTSDDGSGDGTSGDSSDGISHDSLPPGETKTRPGFGAFNAVCMSRDGSIVGGTSFCYRWDGTAWYARKGMADGSDSEFMPNCLGMSDDGNVVTGTTGTFHWSNGWVKRVGKVKALYVAQYTYPGYQSLLNGANIYMSYMRDADIKFMACSGTRNRISADGSIVYNDAGTQHGNGVDLSLLAPEKQALGYAFAPVATNGVGQPCLCKWMGDYWLMMYSITPQTQAIQNAYPLYKNQMWAYSLVNALPSKDFDKIASSSIVYPGPYLVAETLIPQGGQVIGSTVFNSSSSSFAVNAYNTRSNDTYFTGMHSIFSPSSSLVKTAVMAEDGSFCPLTSKDVDNGNAVTTGGIIKTIDGISGSVLFGASGANSGGYPANVSVDTATTTLSFSYIKMPFGSNPAFMPSCSDIAGSSGAGLIVSSTDGVYANNNGRWKRRLTQ